jgi:hypothetical protein
VYRFSKDRETGRFKGIAFVTFPSVDIAESAVRNLNQVPLKGREIYLDFSRERSEWSQRGGERGDWRSGAKERPNRDFQDGQVQQAVDVPDVHYGSINTAQFLQQPQAQSQQFVQLSGGLPLQQLQAQPGQPGQGMVFAAPQSLPSQGAQVVQMPTLIVQPDGRQVLLAAGQPLPSGNVQTLGTMPQGYQVLGTAPGGGTLLQGPSHGVHSGIVTMGQPQADAAGVVLPQVSGAPLVSAMGGMAPEQPQQKAKAPSELQHDLPVGQATAMHVCPTMLCVCFGQRLMRGNFGFGLVC